eukprot:5187099-Pleurochrysis_carterae.AAC.2
MEAARRAAMRRGRERVCVGVHVRNGRARTRRRGRRRARGRGRGRGRAEATAATAPVVAKVLDRSFVEEQQRARRWQTGAALLHRQPKRAHVRQHM